MRYAPLGATGLEVSRICLGTAFRAAASAEVCQRVVRESADLGCNFIDCANAYRDGASEEIVGRAIAGRRSDFIIATKVGAAMPESPGGLGRDAIHRSCEGSLRRLNIDCIDLYLCHFPDPQTPLEETLAALNELQQQGKIRHAGCCNFPTVDFRSALQIARRNDWQPFACNQLPYSLLQRGIETSQLPACAGLGAAVTAFAPTAIGLLSGRFRRDAAPPAGTPWHEGPYNYRAAMTVDVDRVIAAVVGIGRRRGLSPTQIALAWCLSRPQPVSAIVGTDSPQHVHENCTAADVELAPDDLALLERISTGVNLQIRKDSPGGFTAE